MSRLRSQASLVAALWLICGYTCSVVSAEDAQRGGAKAPGDTQARIDDVQRFCRNIAGAAAEARLAWQAAKLAELETRLANRVRELEDRRKALEQWQQLHEAALKRAEESVVSIYGKMRPDAASAQLAMMDENLAAAILTRLPARAASTILNEMDASRAARLTNLIAGAVGAPPEDPRI